MSQGVPDRQDTKNSPQFQPISPTPGQCRKGLEDELLLTTMGGLKSHDRSNKLFTAPSLKPVAPALEIALVRILGRQEDYLGKAHCPKS